MNVNVDSIDAALWMALRVELAQRRAQGRPSRQSDLIEAGLKKELGTAAMETYRALIATHGAPPPAGVPRQKKEERATT